MDPGGFSGCEQDSLVGELIQGMELTKQLKAQLGLEVEGGHKGMLAEQIQCSFEKALWMLKCSGSMEQCNQYVVPSANMPESPISVIGSPKSEDLNSGFINQQDSRDFSRKRKMMPSWTDQVKAGSLTSDTPPEDGYSWRKYGQKDILGAKHPRSYYRCTYRNMQGCCAIKQVQRNDEDPSLFDITYKGNHSCTQTPRSKSAPTSPEKRNKQSSSPITKHQQLPNVLLNFQTGLTVDIQNLENQDAGFSYPTNGSGYERHTFTPSTTTENNYYNSFTPSFIQSSATSASNYFSTSPCNMRPFGGVHQGQQSESDFTEIISATTSATNSPIVSLDFPLDQLEFNPSFPFDNPSIFPSLSFYQAKE